MRGRVSILSVIMAMILGVALPEPGSAEPPLGSLPPVRVEVTGEPTPMDTLQLAILTTTRVVVPDAENVQVALSPARTPLPLPAAPAVGVHAAVQITIAGFRSVSRTVPVEITHTAFPWADAGVLLVSNSPETLSATKVLFSSTLEASQPARLLYHHQNGSTTRRMTITVTLTNSALAPTTLLVTGAGLSSGSDELEAGHRAARSFLDQYWHRAGFLLRIPANTSVPLFTHELPPRGVASGLVQLALVSGDRLALQVATRMDGERAAPSDGDIPDVDAVHQRGTFEQPQLVRPFEHTIGGPPLMMTIGEESDLVHERRTGAPLRGNYGVIYTFPIKISNPTVAPATLELAMHASGGQAGGTFLLDDRILEVPRVRSEGIQTLTTVRLAPGQRRTLTISTMPESGANLPIRLTLGPQ